MAAPQFTTEVECARVIEAPADIVWEIAGDFGSAWHPAMAACQAGPVDGAVERVFTVHGVERTFRERQTFRDDGGRQLRYRMVEGSTVLDRYDAAIRVDGHGRGARIVWSAVLTGRVADAVRAGADETREIFEQGLDFIESRLTVAPCTLEAPRRLGLLCAGEGELVLFLHGIGGRKENWHHQLQAVAGAARAVALDLRGYGESAPAPQPLGLEDHFADISAVMAHFGARRLHLVGMSYGSWIAASFAHAHPELVASLTLSGGCTGMSEAAPETVSGFRQARLAPLDRGLSPADMAGDVVSSLKGPDCPQEAEDELLASMRAIPAATYRAAIECFTAPPFRLRFERWKMPVLMMTGECDRLASPAEIGSVARRIFEARAGEKAPAEVELAVIPRAGHLCNLEAAGTYNGHLRTFIARHRKDTGN